jgi:peptidyl-prolyl cis-trans isomerase A (cyclophilin A)
MFGAAAASVVPPGLPSVTLDTPLGALRILVRTDRAPLSGNDFLKYVQAGAYSGGRFFRVVRAGNDRGHPRIDVVQGGANPAFKSWAPVAHEATSRTGLRHLDRTVSLTRDAPGTGSGNEFFICVGPQPALDAGPGGRNKDGQGYAAFGQVTAGMDIVRRIWVQDAAGHSDDSYTVGQILTRPVPILRAG